MEYFLTESEKNLIEVNKGLGWIFTEFSPESYMIWEKSHRRIFFTCKLIEKRQKLDDNLNDYFLPEKLSELKKAIDDFIKMDRRILMAKPQICKWLRKKLICNLIQRIMRKKVKIIFEKTTELINSRIVETE